MCICLVTNGGDTVIQQCTLNNPTLWLVSSCWPYVVGLQSLWYSSVSFKNYDLLPVAHCFPTAETFFSFSLLDMFNVVELPHFFFQAISSIAVIHFVASTPSKVGPSPTFGLPTSSIMAITKKVQVSHPDLLLICNAFKRIISPIMHHDYYHEVDHWAKIL